ARPHGTPLASWSRRSAAGLDGTPPQQDAEVGLPGADRLVVAAGEGRVDLGDVVEVVDGPRREVLAQRHHAELGMEALAIEVVLADELGQAHQVVGANALEGVEEV